MIFFSRDFFSFACASPPARPPAPACCAQITLDPFNSSVTATTRPVFGPVAVVLYTSPADGLFGPERTRQQVVALDQRNTFGTLFAEIRRAGFFGEFELRTLVQSDATFSLTTRALTTPCFPISKEPGLTLELIALTQGNLVGVLRETFLVRDKFFPVGSDEPELEAGAEGIALKKFNNVSKLFDETDFDVAFLRFEQCQQFSYFLVSRFRDSFFCFFFSTDFFFSSDRRDGNQRMCNGPKKSHKRPIYARSKALMRRRRTAPVGRRCCRSL